MAAAFWPVAQAFERQIDASGGGAAVCVYYEGQKVVDLWGGVRDEHGRPWRADTMSMSFSTSKGITSTLLNQLVDRGELDYDDSIARYWPEFAANGKGTISVRDLMTHRAGLSRIRTLIDRGDRILDWEYMTDRLAAAEARPTTHSAYHALTYGWLTGELIQRVTGRRLGDVIREELEKPLELDGIYIGAPPEAKARAAQLSSRPGSSRSGIMDRIFSDRMATNLTRLNRLVGSGLDVKHLLDALVPPDGAASLFDDERILDVPVPAANGLFTARALAKIYAAIAEEGTLGETRLLSPSAVRRMSQVQVKTPDRVLPVRMYWRLGYHTAFTFRGGLRTGFGHFGFGGSGAWADPSRRLSVAMINNRVGGTPFGDIRIAAIGSSVLHATKRIERDGASASILRPELVA
ncbi:MAG: serine hydrolase domain-containing protein [Myxococcota bacterium]